MPKRTPEPEFDIEDDAEDFNSSEEGFEVDMDVVERIANALENINSTMSSVLKLMVDREAKFAARPPRPSFGDRDRSGPPRPRRDGDDETSGSQLL